MRIRRCGCWRDRAAGACWSAATPLSAERAGRPTSGNPRVPAGRLAAALDAVPKPANIGDPNPLTIRDVKREGDRKVLVDVGAPEGTAVSLFVEGPTPDWALPIPALVSHGPPGVKRFAFDLEGLPP